MRSYLNHYSPADAAILGLTKGKNWHRRAPKGQCSACGGRFCTLDDMLWLSWRAWLSNNNGNDVAPIRDRPTGLQ